MYYHKRYKSQVMSRTVKPLRFLHHFQTNKLAFPMSWMLEECERSLSQRQSTVYSSRNSIVRVPSFSYTGFLKLHSHRMTWSTGKYCTCSRLCYRRGNLSLGNLNLLYRSANAHAVYAVVGVNYLYYTGAIIFIILDNKWICPLSSQMEALCLSFIAVGNPWKERSEQKLSVLLLRRHAEMQEIHCTRILQRKRTNYIYIYI